MNSDRTSQTDILKSMLLTIFRAVAGGVTLALISVQAFAGTAATVHETAFGPQVPADWRLLGDWEPTNAGAVAQGACTASWNKTLPNSALVEVIFDLPDTAALENMASVSLTVGSGIDDPALVTVSCEYQKTSFNATLSGADHDNQKVTVSVSGDTRPSVLREHKRADKDPGWASVTVSIGLVVRHNDCRMMVNGSESRRAALSVSGERKLLLSAAGVTVRRVRVLSAPATNYAYLSGVGIAKASGGLSSQPATGIPAGVMESHLIDVLGVPMVIQSNPDGIMTLDVGDEQYAARTYNQDSRGEGVGFLRTPIPKGIYGAAYLLLHRESDSDGQSAMGFGLRPPTRNAGELKNVYVGDIPKSAVDEGVSVRPVPALGEDWFLARVPLNPVTLQWYRDDGTVFPGDTGKHPRVNLYACRPWSTTSALPTPPWSTTSAVPTPRGQRSSLHLAAVSLEDSAIDLLVTGDGLGNVFSEPETPKVPATLRNLTNRPVEAKVTCELLPFEWSPQTAEKTIVLTSRDSATFNALAAQVSERGHYRVRVVADAGSAGRLEYRTNLALLAPDTRKKINSPFGIWPGTWGDESTDAQRNDLIRKLGVGLARDQITYYGVGHWENVSHMRRPIPDDAAAEAFVKQLSPHLRYFKLGWECSWPDWPNFGFPRVISKNEPEIESPKDTAELDGCVETWRRLAGAMRRLRPDVKVSVGNGPINFVTPLLERGFRPGVEFDYFGTEEAMINALPEQPADAMSNVNWWAQAICEHYGFRDVPIFKGEAIYYSTGPGFSGMSATTQAANYVRAHLLGLPYDAIFSMPATVADSSIGFVYSV